MPHASCLGLFFRRIAAIHPRFGTPAAAIVLSVILGIIFVSSRSFAVNAGVMAAGVMAAGVMAAGVPVYLLWLRKARS